MDLAVAAREPQPEPLGLREISPPLSFKDRTQLFAVEALVPETIVPRAAGSSPRAVSPTTPRMATGFAAIPDNSTAIPPDTHGAVGPNHILTTLNTEVQIQRRDGTVVQRLTLGQFFARAGPFAKGLFDPRAVYDRNTDRFFVVALADDQLPTSSALLLAVSDSGDPSGAWTLYRISPGDDAAGLWFDYPNLVVAGDRLVVTANYFRSNTFDRAQIFVFTVADLLAGSAPFRTFRDARGSVVPASYPSATARIAIFGRSGLGASGRGQLSIGEITGAPGAEVYSGASLNVAVSDPWAEQPPVQDFAPQLGSTARIAANDSRVQQCLARATSIWCVHHVFLPRANPTTAVVQYYELDANTYSLRQSGRVEDTDAAAMHTFPSIAVNRDNDVLIGFSRFRPGDYAQAAYAFRLGADQVNQLQSLETIKRGEAPYRRGSERNRWGDYSAAVTDPVDDLAFWTIQEYAASTLGGDGNRWGTWWAKIVPVAAPCTYSLSGREFPVSGTASTFTVRVTARAGCEWFAASDAGWIGVTAGGLGNGDGTVTLAVIANSGTARSATATIAGQSISVQQAARAPQTVIDAIAHGAAAEPGSIAPGQIVVLYGTLLGPTNLVELRLDGDGRVATELAGTRILFQGIPAPVIYTSAGQAAAVVPYSVAGRTSVFVQAEFNGTLSGAVTAPVTDVRPGIFTLDFSGRGPGAIVNQDGVVNAATAAAPRGSIVSIYATGGGALLPSTPDGQVIGEPLPSLVAQPVEVTVGGIAARVPYAGPAPGFVSGGLQINVEIPADAPVGASVPLTLRIGGVAARSGVTMAVR